MAIISVLGSGHSGVTKLIWILVILILPVVGMILWFLIGSKKSLG